MMKRMGLLLVFAGIVLAAWNAFGLVYSIQLKNGNTIQTEQYWKENGTVRFFMNGGFVSLPQDIITHIAKKDETGGGGMVSTQVDYFMDDDNDETDLSAALPTGGDSAGLRDEIQDRLLLVETNIANLNKNKNIYMQQLAAYVNDREKAESKIEKLKQTPYMTSEDLKERMQIEENKLADIEQKSRDVQGSISRNETMLGVQLKMKQRLEDELARLQ